MARDYKRRAQRKPKKQPRSALFVFFSGVFTGAIAVSVAAWLLIPASEAPNWIGKKPAVLSELDPVSTDPADEPAAKPTKFDFYTLLPEMEVVVPDSEIEEPPRPVVPASSSSVAERTGPDYLLQVGSFRSIEDAEKLRAKLALLGMEAHVRSIRTDSGQNWNRVRLGPFSAGESLQSARKRLSENGLSSLVILKR